MFPRWLHSSDAIGLSAMMNITGAMIIAVWPIAASYMGTPSSSFNRLLTSGVANSNASAWLEVQMKCMFSSCALSDSGRPGDILEFYTYS